MAKLPNLKTGVLLLLAGLIVLFLVATYQMTSAGSHTVYLPLVHNPPATLEHGGLHPWPHVTITPAPEVPGE